MNRIWLTHCKLVLPHQILEGSLELVEGRIGAILEGEPAKAPGERLDLKGLYVAPGFIDLHVHGGGGADFMDGTPEAFETVTRSHFRHGTTTLLPTTTAGSAEAVLKMVRTAARLGQQPQESKGKAGASRMAGVHLYGPHFHEAAKGCHPVPEVFSPDKLTELFSLSQAIRAATIAPEHPQAWAFAHLCQEKGIRLHMGHSHCTFDQAREAVGWGVRHVDHLFCAMSDRARLRPQQPWPMRGGLFEATLVLDGLTTEVIADGCHLAPELLQLAWRVKGADRLALVTDAMRAMDLPPGEYRFGPEEGGTRVVSNGRVGLMLDGVALASAVQGMDEGVRNMARATAAPLPEVIRMATLTPARIAGLDRDLGSLESGKIGDLVVLDEELRVRAAVLSGDIQNIKNIF